MDIFQILRGVFFGSFFYILISTYKEVLKPKGLLYRFLEILSIIK
nr:MAG TPA: hypothetical protein [Caudoviricetes sp.]